ncbi:MAG: hypothetical protein WC879_07925 [Melioribacteraceae bacterium]
MTVFSHSLLSDGLIENTPAIVNGSTSFTYALKANNYDGSYNNTLTLNSKSLEVVVAIGNYSLGRVIIDMYNEDNINIFHGDYVEGVALSQSFNSETFAKKIQLTLTKVTASVSLVIKAK